MQTTSHWRLASFNWRSWQGHRRSHFFIRQHETTWEQSISTMFWSPMKAPVRCLCALSSVCIPHWLRPSSLFGLLSAFLQVDGWDKIWWSGRTADMQMYRNVWAWKRSPYYWHFVMGNHRWSVDSLHKGPVLRSFDVSSVVILINGGVTGDLGHHDAQVT